MHEQMAGLYGSYVNEKMGERSIEVGDVLSREKLAPATGAE